MDSGHRAPCRFAEFSGCEGGGVAVEHDRIGGEAPPVA